MVGLSLLAFSSAQATSYTWLPTGPTGTWDTTTSNWNDGGANSTTWVNGATSDASFSSFAADATITLGEVITAGSLTTNGGSNVIFNGTKTMDINTITTQNGGNVGSIFMYNVLTGDHDLTFNGGGPLGGESGRLNFKAAANYTGDTNLTGTAYLTFASGINNSLPTTTTVNMGSGLSTLRFTSKNQTQEIAGLTGTNASAYIRNYGLTGNILTINTKSGVTTAYEGRMIEDISLVVSGSGTQRLASPNSSYTGSTTIRGGTLNAAWLANGGVTSAIGASSSAATNLVFDGGTLKYTGASVVTDRAFTINDGKTATIETTNNLTFVGATGTATTGALTKTGGGILTLTGTNTYTGVTTINNGVLAVNGSITSSVTVNNGGTLGGSGTITGDLTVKSGGKHDVGNSPGIETITGNTSYESGSIFSWDLAANLDGDTSDSGDSGTRGTHYDGVNMGGNLDIAAGAVFRVIQNSGVDFADNFWDINQTWNDIFNVTGTTTSGWLNDAVSVYNTSGGLVNVSTYGSFTVSGKTLTWSAVPEPSSSLAAVLLAAGLLRRRRK